MEFSEKYVGLHLVTICGLQCRYYFTSFRLESIDRNLARACGTLLSADACRDLREILGDILREFRRDSAGEQPRGNHADPFL